MLKQEELLEQLNKNLTELNNQLKKQNSFGRGLAQSMLRGLGSFVGTIVVTGIAFYLISRLLQSSDFQMQFQQAMQKFVENTVNTTFKNMGLPRWNHKH